MKSETPSHLQFVQENKDKKNSKRQCNLLTGSKNQIIWV